ncbi:c-type cytochrome [Mameliella sediminis]|uniref:c-type cytochrome n=1 Tax=Mameliella sediminis TaxID=2836866 RepID=UPI001C473E1A|nr:cytochrome c family protein [Mameliella sediminis]MBY6117062.1 cytochrome c family protein [Antarctobacter heliothermus]MBY6146814.1 cytochrome c family protein [Mameliella alba]MBV7396304.1 cytochrome c family protein [Mameliella sediminis]MBY6160714.1 cytochrome c family protein [Mameliella alba]MBY6169184.1 cytochrome c family protein [Mameliella alba]
MFDTMTFTKIVGGVCGALLIYLMGKWAAEVLYHPAGHGHGEEHAAGFAILVDDGPAPEAEEGPDFATLMAAADAGKGEKVWGKCRACHKLDGTDGTGPHLDGVVERAVGSVAGFGYSGKLSEAADVWTPENLFAFLENPKGFAPGTTMGFAGLKKAEDRVNLIAYLQTTGN